jgi:hypothetical protein
MTGARRGELAALRWNDLDGDRLTIDSSVAIIRFGDRVTKTEPVLRDDPTKTGNRRSVTLDPTTLSMLASLRAEREPWGPWILAVGERPVNPERITAWWRRAASDAGLDPKWRLHDLRHWSATTAIAAGHDIRTVANRLGHANPAMTLRVYAHAIQSADVGVAVTFAESLSGLRVGGHGRLTTLRHRASERRDGYRGGTPSVLRGAGQPGPTPVMEADMVRQLTVDFNRVVADDLIRANARRAVPGTPLQVGAVVIVGDDDWGVVAAEVIEHDEATGSLILRLRGELVDEERGELQQRT